MIRQALQQSLRSAKRTSKPKPFWLASTSKLTTKPNASLSNSNREYVFNFTSHGRYFCTANKNVVAPSLQGLTVTRSEPELVGPAKPTPRGLKKLSFLDDRDYLRVLMPMIQVYRYDPSMMQGKDPARVIRDALAQALVLYYPLAGRLREGVNGRISVDCTGEGVWFVEADANVELHQLGDPPQPHLPWFQEFLYDAPPTFGVVLNSPLFYIQVTRLKCGGFVLALRLNHLMCDGAGLTQFLNAVGEIARGAHDPSVTPVWDREIFGAPDSSHEKEEHPPANSNVIPVNKPDLAQRSIFLGPSKLVTIRNLARDHHSTTFETLTACLWRSRTSVLELDPEDKVGLGFVINARDKTNKVVPAGYYGNAAVAPMVATTARKLCERPIGYAIGLLKKGKEEGTKEYMSWRTDTPMIGINLFHCSWDKCLLVTDIRQLGYGDVDFGWGKTAYAGLASVDIEGGVSYVPYKNHSGEDGILVSICLQAQIMGRFETELDNMLVYG